MNAVVLLRAVGDPELAHGVMAGDHRLDDASLTALAEALAWRSETPGARLTGVALGPPEWDAALREAVALGLDDLTRAWAEPLRDADVVATAVAIAEAIPDETLLVFAGSAAADHGSGVLPVAVAELLGWPALAEVTGLHREGESLVAHVRAGGGRRRLHRVEPPAVVVMARMPAPPLYPRLAARLAARRRPIAESTPACGPLVAEAATRLQLSRYGPARPLTRHLFRPSADARPAQRLRQLMAGGMGGRGGQKIEAAEDDGPAALAGQLVEILVKEGLVPDGG